MSKAKVEVGTERGRYKEKKKGRGMIKAQNIGVLDQSYWLMGN